MWAKNEGKIVLPTMETKKSLNKINKKWVSLYNQLVKTPIVTDHTTQEYKDLYPIFCTVMEKCPTVRAMASYCTEENFDRAIVFRLKLNNVKGNKKVITVQEKDTNRFSAKAEWKKLALAKDANRRLLSRVGYMRDGNGSSNASSHGSTIVLPITRPAPRRPVAQLSITDEANEVITNPYLEMAKEKLNNMGLRFYVQMKKITQSKNGLTPKFLKKLLHKVVGQEPTEKQLSLLFVATGSNNMDSMQMDVFLKWIGLKLPKHTETESSFSRKG
jgi:hypothetical protein